MQQSKEVRTTERVSLDRPRLLRQHKSHAMIQLIQTVSVSPRSRRVSMACVLIATADIAFGAPLTIPRLRGVLAESSTRPL
jgi:hypothetical protein